MTTHLLIQDRPTERVDVLVAIFVVIALRGHHRANTRRALLGLDSADNRFRNKVST